MEKNLGGKAREEIGVRGFREWNDGSFFFTYSVGYENVYAFSGKFVTAHQLICTQRRMWPFFPFLSMSGPFLPHNLGLSLIISSF